MRRSWTSCCELADGAPPCQACGHRRMHCQPECASLSVLFKKSWGSPQE